MIYALVKFYTTKNHKVANNMSIWGASTTLWPTFMLLAVALVTLVLNIVTICAYFRSVEKANSTNNVAGYIGYGLLAVHVLVWAVSMGLFKMANTGKDLWGWSCGAGADAIQEEVISFVDFGKLCTTQVRRNYAFTLSNFATIELMRIPCDQLDRSILHHHRSSRCIRPHLHHLRLEHAAHVHEEETGEDAQARGRRSRGYFDGLLMPSRSTNILFLLATE